MADKTKTIKNATDQELVDLINRLRRERELQDIVRDIKRRSIDMTYTRYEDLEREMQISTESPIESLYHFGVKGMKWGIRKDRASGTRKKARRATKSTKDKAPANKKSSSSTKSMTDEELKKRVSRLQMEQQYSKLTATQKSKGRQMVEEVLTNSAKQTATTYVTKYMSKQVENLLGSKAG